VVGVYGEKDKERLTTEIKSKRGNGNGLKIKMKA
jgi:hypothetical protein